MCAEQPTLDTRPSRKYKMSMLEAQQIEQLRTVFTVFAAAAPPPYEGTLAVREHQLTSVLNALGIAATEESVGQLISQTDTQGRGFLDFDEFVQLMAGELEDIDTDAELVECFHHLDGDGDGDGKLGVGDVNGALAGSVGGSSQHEVALTPADLQGIIFEMSGPGAKGISLDQFVSTMRSQQ